MLPYCRVCRSLLWIAHVVPSMEKYSNGIRFCAMKSITSISVESTFFEGAFLSQWHFSNPLDAESTKYVHTPLPYMKRFQACEHEVSLYYRSHQSSTVEQSDGRKVGISKNIQLKIVEENPTTFFWAQLLFFFFVCSSVFLSFLRIA